MGRDVKHLVRTWPDTPESRDWLTSPREDIVLETSSGPTADEIAVFEQIGLIGRDDDGGAELTERLGEVSALLEQAAALAGTQERTERRRHVLVAPS